MSTVLRSLPYTRYIRQVRTDKDQLVATQATLNAGFELLKMAPWRQARNGLSVTMPASDPTVTTSSDAYDAYKFGGDCAAGSGRQAAFLGMAAYRFKLPDDAQNVGAHDNVTLATIRAYSNKFLAAGLMVTAYINDFDTPGELFNTGNTDADFNSYRSADTNLGAVLPETAEHQAGTKTALNGSATLNVIAGATEAKKYLWVFIQLWDWTQIKWEYWIEGAGFLDAETINVTFDRTGVTADSPDTTFSFPVEVDDLIEPSKVYPLHAFPLNSVIAYPHLAVIPVTGDIRCMVGSASAHTVAGIYTDGTVFTHGVLDDIPETAVDVVDIACGNACVFAVTRSGALIAWGLENANQFTIPTYQKWCGVSASSDNDHVLGITSDSIVLAWGGSNVYGQRTVPEGLIGVVSVTAASHSSWAVKSDGSVVSWGGSLATTTPALTGVLRIFCGAYHAAALHADGSVTFWGSNTSSESVLPEGVTNSGIVSMALGFHNTAILKSDGSVVAWGDDSEGLVTFLNGKLGVRQLTMSSSSDGCATILQRNMWDQYGISYPADFSVIPDSFDSDVRRELMIRAAVANTLTVTPFCVNTQGGEYAITNRGNMLTLAAASKGFRYYYRTTNSRPNKIHFSLPPLTADAEGEIYFRVVVLKDTNTVPVNPISTTANWKLIWQGETPTGYTCLASQYIRHTGFANSRFIELADPGYSGVLWMIIMPIHAPLAGDSLAWDVTQTGWNADAVFMYRD